MIHTIGKLVLGMAGLLRAMPTLLGFVLWSRLFGIDRAFLAASESLSRVPGPLGVHTRQAFYSRILARVGKDVHFGFMSLLSKPMATIGDRVYIGRFCSIGWAELGDDVMLADGVQILSGRHQHGSGATCDAPMRDHDQHFTMVTIGKGAWLGANAVIMADVGEHAIVAAGAVVTKPVPAGAKVAGVPARLMINLANAACP